MGGKEGSRGYLYQSIATVMDTLLDEKWIAVEVEPDTANDKVDILWLYENDKKKIVQVKSSENNISRADIINWLEELVEDVNDADEYKLMLIGNCNDVTSTFITKINKRNFSNKEDKDYEDLSEVKVVIPKIKIQLDNFQLTALEAQIHHNVNKLLAKMGHLLHPSIIDQIAGAMVYQFSKFSTDGTRLSREEYIERIQTWAYFNYPEIKGQGLVKKALDVSFYYKDREDFTNKMSSISLPIQPSNLFSDKLKQSISKIQQYELPSKSKIVSANEESAAEEEALAKVFQVKAEKYRFEYSEMSDSNKEEMIRRIRGLLGVKVEESFFYVGNLKERKSVFSNNREIEGTDEEKEKGELLDDFLIEFYEYEQKYNYLNYLGEFYWIPLVLRNNGQSYDSDIEVNIKLPNHVEVITKENLKIPDSIAIDFFIEENGFLERFLKHSRDYQLEEYVGYSPVSISPHFITPLRWQKTYKQIQEEKIKEFKDCLDDMFDFELYEEKEQTILQYYFRELNAKKNMAFPAFVLVKADATFHMQYEITSKHLGNKILGELIYEI